MKPPIPWPKADDFIPGPESDEEAAAPESGTEDDDTIFWDNMIFPI